MAVPKDRAGDRKPVEARPRDGVDRDVLRDEISRRYEHTLRRLGK